MDRILRIPAVWSELSSSEKAGFESRKLLPLGAIYAVCSSGQFSIINGQSKSRKADVMWHNEFSKIRGSSTSLGVCIQLLGVSKQFAESF